MTMSRRFRLWGFDGDLEGEEARLQGRLPFFQARSDPRVFAARRTDWDFSSQENLIAFSSEAEAERYGTRLQLDRSRRVSPGQLVILCGPGFVSDLRAVSLDEQRKI